MLIPYIKVMKHAEKITKKVSATRPILTGVMHSRDSSLTVTDSHRMYHINNMSHGLENVVINPKTGDYIDGNYPETSRLIPEDDGKLTVNVNISQALEALRAMKIIVKANDKSEAVRFVTENGTLSIDAGDDQTHMEMKYIVGDLDNGHDDISMLVSSTYLYEGLDFLKDVGYEEVIFNFYGNERPFTLVNNDTTVLILPIREG